MEKKVWFEFQAKMMAAIQTTTQKKNHDYTGGSQDAFANFKLIEHLTQGRITSADGILTRISDKVARINSYLANGSLAVKDESAFDSAIDGAAYFLLLAGVIHEKNQNNRRVDGPKQADAIRPEFKEASNGADRQDSFPDRGARL